MVNVVRNLVAVLVGIGAWPRVGDDKSRFFLIGSFNTSKV